MLKRLEGQSLVVVSEIITVGDVEDTKRSLEKLYFTRICIIIIIIIYKLCSIHIARLIKTT